MATVREPLLLAISSPRKGALWEAYRAHYGQDSDVLVWQAATRAMNPTVPQAFIDSELQKDEASARAEYLALFRVDIESFLSREIIQGCIEPGRHSRPPLDGVSYTAFVDPSGGVGDSFALAIAHQEGDDVVLDLVHERRAPLSPEQTVEEFVSLLKTYRVRGVTGDRYSEEFARELFRKHGVDYSVSPWSRSDLFVETLPMLTSRRARLLDDERLVAQLLSLERRTGGSGKDMITPIPAMGTTTSRTQRPEPSFTWAAKANWASRTGPTNTDTNGPSPSDPSSGSRSSRPCGTAARLGAAGSPRPARSTRRRARSATRGGRRGSRSCGGSVRGSPSARFELSLELSFAGPSSSWLSNKALERPRSSAWGLPDPGELCRRLDQPA